MTQRWRLRFASQVPEDERRVIHEALSAGLAKCQRLLPDQSRVKSFYLLETRFRPLFAKARVFPNWTRRLGRSFRRTKEEQEFQNYLTLEQRGVPCPEPVGSARLYEGVLIKGSLLLLQFLPSARPLRELLRDPQAPTAPVLEGLAAFLGLLRERGVIHEDLQWDNLLVQDAPTGPKFYLVDALHIRWDDRDARESFPRTLAWFLHFLISGQAPQEAVEGFLDRVCRRGLDGGLGEKGLLEAARRFAKRP
jgi:tRNA A-37 threonylcarbamoyl transferase component Bud32